MRSILGVIAAALCLAGCQSLGLGGGRPLAYAPGADGTVGLIGSQIGAGLSADDRRSGLDAEYRALELGETGVVVEWRGAGGVAGSVVPGPRYRVNDYDCRQFTDTVVAVGTTETAQGTACRGADGTWRLVG